MIYFSFHIGWPFKYDPDFFGDYFSKSWQLTKHKFLEIQAYKGGDDIIGGSFRLTWRANHAGLMIDLSLLRRSLTFQIYDHRHWDDEKGCYVNYDDPEEVEKYW